MNFLEKLASKPTTKNRLIRVFTDTNLKNNHLGLEKIAKSKDVDVSKLDMGEFVVFVNRKRNALKMYAPGNIVAHLKLPENTKIDMRTIALLPKHFNGGEINYSGALKEYIKKEFPLLK
jgi:hypothetical protein